MFLLRVGRDLARRIHLSLGVRLRQSDLHHTLNLLQEVVEPIWLDDHFVHPARFGLVNLALARVAGCTVSAVGISNFHMYT
jgi:hypothetical protein